MRRAYADIPEGQMHYRYEGNGEPILLLHMTTSASDEDEYERMAPFLSKKYRVIAPDLLGYGESDKPQRSYTIREHAKSIISLMDALQITKTSIGGHHIGSTVSLEVALNWPERVNKLFMSCLPYWRDEKAPLAEKNNPNFQRVEADSNGGHLMEWWRRANLYGYPANITDERCLCMHKAGSRGEEIRWAAFDYSTNLRNLLPKVKVPTLLIASTRDALAPLQQDVKQLIPGSKLVEIKDGSVYVTRTMPKEFAECIRNFLETTVNK